MPFLGISAARKPRNLLSENVTLSHLDIKYCSVCMCVCGGGHNCPLVPTALQEE